MNDKRFFFMSDPHFYHTNIIKYSNRPFKNVDEMNSTLIKNINITVRPQDELYVLGDFLFGDVKRAEGILNNIHCQNKHYIFGNHDDTMFDPSLKRFFKSMQDYKVIYIKDSSAYKGKQMICLFHFPILEWDKGHKGSWMLHGHCHGNLTYPESIKNCRIADIGVDCWNYTPVSYEELKFKFKNCENITHHGD